MAQDIVVEWAAHDTISCVWRNYMELKVIYNKKGKVDMALDRKIKKALKPLGFKFYASGCNRLNGERDIAFDDKK